MPIAPGRTYEWESDMAGLLKGKPLSALIFFIIIGIIIGSYLNNFLELLPYDKNVVKMIFTYAYPLGIGDFINNKPLLINLGAIKLQLGFQLKFSTMSLVGIIVSLYMFRWYR
jgi:hypothetical protein